MPVIFGQYSDKEFGVRLYPEFDEQQFRSVAREITAVALHVAYSAVEAAAEIETIPAEWLAHLDEARSKFDDSLPAIQRDWDEHERRHKVLTGRVRHDSELDKALNDDETSVRNLRKAYDAGKQRDDE
jgi:NADH:ubiquinone oxidoreductase subunit